MLLLSPDWAGPVLDLEGKLGCVKWGKEISRNGVGADIGRNEGRLQIKTDEEIKTFFALHKACIYLQMQYTICHVKICDISSNQSLLPDKHCSLSIRDVWSEAPRYVVSLVNPI